MITELYVAHYKSIQELTIPLGQVNVLVGRNGSGKSNIVDAISFLNDVATEDLDYAITKRHGADSVRQWSKYRPFHVTIQATIKTRYGQGFYRLTFSSSRNNYRVVDETIEWYGESTYDEDKYKVVITRNSECAVTVTMDPLPDDVTIDDITVEPHETILAKIERRHYDLTFFVGYIIQDLRSFSSFSIFPNTIRSPQSVSKSTDLEPDGKNIASIIKQMTGERKRNRDRIVKSLKVALPQLNGITIKSTAGFYVPVFMVGDESGGSHELNMSQISDGTLRMMGILTAFAQPRAPLRIALEEPEQMIHPALLLVIKDAVDDFIRRRKETQVFITTHSSVFIDQFDPADVIAVENLDGVTKAGRVSKRQLQVVKSGLMSLGEVLLAEDLEVA